MKREDVTAVFEGATKEQIDKILNLNSADIEKVKTATETERDRLRNDLDTANQKLSDFEGVDVDDLNAKLTAAAQQITALQAELSAEKTTAAVRLGLVEAKALDVDYLIYKLTEKLKSDGKTAELDDTGKVKDWDTLLEGLQKQFPTQFESCGIKHIEEHRLPDNDNGVQAEPATLADALHGFYESET